MKIRGLVRQIAVPTLVFSALTALGGVAFGQDYGLALNMVARVQSDVGRVATYSNITEKQRMRYDNLERRLSQVDYDLNRNRFDKGKLSDAINDLKGIIQNNPMDTPDRDRLVHDLADLRTLRDLH